MKTGSVGQIPNYSELFNNTFSHSFISTCSVLGGAAKTNPNFSPSISLYNFKDGILRRRFTSQSDVASLLSDPPLHEQRAGKHRLRRPKDAEPRPESDGDPLEAKAQEGRAHHHGHRLRLPFCGPPGLRRHRHLLGRRLGRHGGSWV